MPDFFEEPAQLPDPSQHLVAATTRGKQLRRRHRLGTSAAVTLLLATVGAGVAVAATGGPSNRATHLVVAAPSPSAPSSAQAPSQAEIESETVFACVGAGDSSAQPNPTKLPHITAGQALVAIRTAGLDEAITRQLPALALTEVTDGATSLNPPHAEWVAVVTGFDFTPQDFSHPATDKDPSPPAITPVYHSEYFIVDAQTGIANLSSRCTAGSAAAPAGWAATPLTVTSPGSYTLTVPVPAGVQGITVGPVAPNVVRLPDTAPYFDYSISPGIRVIATHAGLVAQVHVQVTHVRIPYADFTLWLTPGL